MTGKDYNLYLEGYKEGMSDYKTIVKENERLKRVISLLAIGGIPPEKQLIDFGYTKEDWVFMMKTVDEIITGESEK